MSLGRSKRKQMNLAPTIYSTLCKIESLGDGYVPTAQNYDSFTDSFDPDYQLSPQNLFPRCTLIDPDSPIASISVNEKLMSVSWYEVTDAGSKLVYSTGGAVADGYGIVDSGEYKGQLIVKKNGIVGKPRAMRFIGSYTDPSSGYVYRFEDSIPLKINDMSAGGAELSIDSDKALTYNPLRMSRYQTIIAKVNKGGKDITGDERCKLLWFRRASNGTETPLTAESDVDNIEIVESTKSSNGSITSIKIDREMFGDGQTYAVYAMYRADKNFPSSPTSEDARAYTTITRQFPELFVRIQGDGLMSSNTLATNVKAIVSDNQGDLDNWDEFLYASWKVQDGASEREVMRGKEVLFPLTFGKSFFCDIEDRGTNKVLVTDNGEWLVDESGNPIVARDYEDII